jgi:hypothetical protein
MSGIKGINIGEKNGQWKGDRAGYKAIHIWINFNVPKPESCSSCGSIVKLEAANKSGKYLRDFSDWEWLCRRCHMKSDGRLEGLIKRNKKDGCNGIRS